VSINNSQGISFIIENLELLKKNLELPQSSSDEPFKFLFDVGLDVKVNEEQKKTMHVVHITIRSEQTEEALGALSVACFFHVFNFDEISSEIDGNKRIPQEHIDLLNTIAIGAARGIMYSEFRGTFLANAILPVLDIKKFGIDREAAVHLDLQQQLPVMSPSKTKKTYSHKE
jgi:hypothetical protein